MLSSINPLVERGRNNRFGVTATAYVVGSVAGGTVAGALAGAAGALVASVTSPSATARGVAAVLILAAALAVDAGLFGLRIPTTRRQVDENWLGRYRGWVYGAGFGFQLGLGVVTIVTSAMVYATFALAFVTGHVAAGASIGAVFGLVRALPLLTGVSIRDTASLRSFHRRLAARAGAARRLGLAANAVLLAASAVAVAR